MTTATTSKEMASPVLEGVRSGTLSTWATTLVLRAGSTLATVANVAVLARLLGPADSGRYFVFAAAVLVGAVVIELGLSQSATVFASLHPGARATIHRTLVRWVLILSAATTVIALAGGAVASRWGVTWMPVSWFVMLIVSVPLTLYGNVWNGFAVGAGRVVYAGGVQLVTVVVMTILDALCLGIFHQGVTAAVAISTLVSAGQAVWMGIAIRGFCLADLPAPPQFGPDMMRFGLRGYAGSLSSFLWMRATIFLLDAFHGPAAVGIFSIAQQLAERLLLPAQVIKDVIYREVASADRAAATGATNRYLRLALAALVPLTVVVAWLAPFLVSALFGGQYAPAAVIFRVLFVGTVVMIVPTVLVPFFLGHLQRPGLLSILAWINVVVNGLLALLLVPRFAAYGAAIALVGTQLLGTAIAFVIYLASAKTTVSRAVILRVDDLIEVRREVQALIRGL